jgi:hypothetical protein
VGANGTEVIASGTTGDNTGVGTWHLGHCVVTGDPGSGHTGGTGSGNTGPGKTGNTGPGKTGNTGNTGTG